MESSREKSPFLKKPSSDKTRLGMKRITIKLPSPALTKLDENVELRIETEA